MLQFAKLSRTIICSLVFISSILFCSETKAQTTLYAGDVAFLGVQEDNNYYDTFCVILLKDILSGTQIGFTDGCYRDATQYHQMNSTKADWYFVWQASANLSAGTILQFWNSTGTNGGTAVASTGTIVQGNALSLNNNGLGDQVFAFQGIDSLNESSPYTIDVTRHLAGIHMNYQSGVTADANWDDGLNSLPASELPDSLVTGVSAIRLDSSNVEENGARMTSKVLSLDKTVINDKANWTVSNTMSMPAIPLRLTWNGSSWGGTPSSTIPCIINSSTSTGGFTGGDLRVNSGYSFTISSGQAVQVYGDFWNYGSDISGTGELRFFKTSSSPQMYGNATNFEGIVRVANSVTLITNGLLTLKASSSGYYGQIAAGGTYGGSISGNITASYYIGSGGYGWRSICSPLDGATLSQIDDDVTLNFGTPNATYTNVYTYDESGSSPHWHAPADTSQSMNTGGFAVFLRDGNVPITIDITGTYHGTSDYTVSGLTYTGSTTDTSGWHYIRNPWPTSFYWDGSISNVQGAAAYLYDQTAGTYTTFDNIFDGIIPPFTAMLIQVSSNNVSVTLPNSYRNPGYADNTFDKTGTAQNHIALTVKNPKTGITDAAQFYTDDAAKNTFDIADGTKRMNDAKAPSFYFISNGKKLYKEAWQNIPDGGADLPMAISTQSNGVHEINIDMENMDAGTTVYLEDLQEHKLHNASAGTYSFTVNEGDAPGRFVLHLRKSGVASGIATEVQSQYFIGSNGSIVTIGSSRDEKIEVKITDLLGREIFNDSVTTVNGNVAVVPVQAPASGYYVVNVCGAGGTQVAKIFLK